MALEDTLEAALLQTAESMVGRPPNSFQTWKQLYDQLNNDLELCGSCFWWFWEFSTEIIRVNPGDVFVRDEGDYVVTMRGFSNDTRVRLSAKEMTHFVKPAVGKCQQPSCPCNAKSFTMPKISITLGDGTVREWAM